jgi:hypothetical protein
VRVTAYSAERLLKYRLSPRSQTLTGVAGDVFSQLIKLGNKTRDTLIREGDLWLAGIVRNLKVDLTTAYDGALELVKRSGNDFSIEPEVLPDGSIAFSANWFEKRGIDTGFKLVEGKHIETGSVYTEQGEVYNRITAYQTVEDAESIKKYGLREKAIQVDGKTETDVKAAAQAELAKCKEPRQTFSLSALDVDNVFSLLRQGNTFEISFSTIGFTGSELGTEASVRIVGMSYADSSEGKCSLVCDQDGETND